MELINDKANHEWEFQYDSVEKTLKAGFYDENGKLELNNKVYEVEAEKLYLALELIARYYILFDGLEGTLENILENPYYYDDPFSYSYDYSKDYLNKPLDAKEEEMRKELLLDLSYNQAISIKREREKREEKLKQELGDNYLPF